MTARCSRSLASGPNSRATGHQVEAHSRPDLVNGLLTTAPNSIVEPIHPQAMPVILTTDQVRAPWDEARALERLLAGDG
jgi:putative SOS response-associated peptidase YedK